MKNLPRFLIRLREDSALLSTLSSSEHFLFITDTVTLFHRMQVQTFTTADIITMYHRGVTYKELEKITGRPFQSIGTSVNSKVDAKTVQEHKKNRKIWVALMNYATYVYEADKAGTWGYLEEKFPHMTLARIKQRYRLSGGRFLFDLQKQQREEERAKVRLLADSGLDAKTIASSLDIPISTVYLRLKETD